MAPRSNSRFTSRQESKFHKVMREYKTHQLHSGSKRGPKVRSRKQALAIAFSEANALKNKTRRFR